MDTSHLLNVTIAHPTEILFSGAVKMITVPSSEGEITLLAHHEPIIVLLKKGTITLQTGDSPEKIPFKIDGGVLEVSHNTATILL